MLSKILSVMTYSDVLCTYQKEEKRLKSGNKKDGITWPFSPRSVRKLYSTVRCLPFFLSRRHNYGSEARMRVARFRFLICVTAFVQAISLQSTRVKVQINHPITRREKVARVSRLKLESLPQKALKQTTTKISTRKYAEPHLYAPKPGKLGVHLSYESAIEVLHAYHDLHNNLVIPRRYIVPCTKGKNIVPNTFNGR